MFHYFHILSLLLFIVSFSAKKTFKTFSFKELKENSWRYLTKFGYERGTGTFNIKAKLTNPIKNSLYPYEQLRFQLSVFLDIEFPQALERHSCGEKNAWSRYHAQISIPTNGEWSADLTSKLGNNARPYVWYFTISDCIKDFERFLEGDEYDTKVQFEINIINTDGSQLSIESKYYFEPFLVLILVCTIILSYNLRILYQQYKTDMKFDNPLLFVNGAIFAQLLSLICEAIHLYIYSYNGTGSFIFTLLHQIFSVGSQFIFTFLLILLSWGWTISFTEFESMSFFLPFSIIIGLLQIFFVIVSKNSDDEYYKFHDYEDWAGKLILMFRISIFYYFLKGIYRTFSEANQRVRFFILKMGFFGSIYFLAVPAISIINTFIAQYCRHQVMEIGSLILQILGMIIFTVLFNKKKGDYYDISVYSNPLLPMNQMKKGKID